MVQKISKERLERSLAEDENLSKLTNTTKNWLRQNIVKDNDVKATNKTEKAADKLINTKSKGIINWVKDNPIETALLFTGGAGLARGVVKYMGKKYGPKAVKKVKEIINDKKPLLKLEYKKKSTPTGNINKATPPSVIRQGSSTTATASQKEAQAKIMKKINESKTFKNLNADDKKKVVNEFAKVGKGKPITSIISQVIKKNGKTKSIISKPVKVDKKPVKVDTKPVKVDTKPVKADKKIVKADKKIVKADKKPIVSKDTQILLTRKLVKDFKNNSNSITKQINSSNMDSLNKKRLINTLQDTVNFLQKKKGSTIGEALKGAGIKNPLKILKKGGLIKRNMGGNLKQPPAGNKGLRKLPTPVRNKMGFAKRGGVVKKNTGGFLGAGKALRGQGAVMRKRGGKIGY